MLSYGYLSAALSISLSHVHTLNRYSLTALNNWTVALGLFFFFFLQSVNHSHIVVCVDLRLISLSGLYAETNGKETALRLQSIGRTPLALC